jgi:hypothetical protein
LTWAAPGPAFGRVWRASHFPIRSWFESLVQKWLTTPEPKGLRRRFGRGRMVTKNEEGESTRDPLTLTLSRRERGPESRRALYPSERPSAAEIVPRAWRVPDLTERVHRPVSPQEWYSLEAIDTNSLGAIIAPCGR